MEKRVTITIMKVANGYVVMPERGLVGTNVRIEETYVFETFESVVIWLAGHFKDGD